MPTRGSLEGKVVLAQHRDIDEPETDGRYTVKVFESVAEQATDCTWRPTRVTLRPSSTDPAFRPIVLEGLAEGELRVIAELVEVLGPRSRAAFCCDTIILDDPRAPRSRHRAYGYFTRRRKQRESARMSIRCGRERQYRPGGKPTSSESQ